MSVAMVVPSQAISLVLEATSRTIWAPMFSKRSSSSISSAMVVPSLVSVGRAGAVLDDDVVTLGAEGELDRVVCSARRGWRRLRGMGHAAERTKISEQEYLALERAAEQRHEYADGEIFAMAGGTWEHSLIASNINGELRAALLGRPCVAQGAAMRCSGQGRRAGEPKVLALGDAFRSLRHGR